ncbi:MAG: hypothetical protein ACRBK7_03680 [Acidimicrobiales bacterium]
MTGLCHINANYSALDDVMLGNVHHHSRLDSVPLPHRNCLYPNSVDRGRLPELDEGDGY